MEVLVSLLWEYLPQVVHIFLKILNFILLYNQLTQFILYEQMTQIAVSIQIMVIIFYSDSEAAIGGVL